MKTSANELSDSLVGGKKEVKFPLMEIFEIFGRFVGIILATVFDGPDKGNISEFRDEIQRSMREVLKCFGFGSSCCHCGEGRKRSGTDFCGFCESGKEIKEFKAKSEREEKEEGADSATIERDLEELKRQLSEQSGRSRDVSDRAVDLISRSTSFFSVIGTFEYHLCPYGNDSKFTGLISYLAKMCGGNPHDEGIICARGSANGTQARNVADLQTDSAFCSNSAAGQWVGYDFKDMRVAVTHYILRSNPQGRGGPHLRPWVVEGSPDNKNWLELDCRKDENGLNGANSVCCFAVREVVESRFIRIRTTGADWYESDYLYFQAFDVFWRLARPWFHQTGLISPLQNK
jgi:uncharacterized Zn finger protein (UPF0148 family)